MINGPFSASPVGCATLGVTSTSSNVALASTLTDGVVRIDNIGPNTAYIRLGSPVGAAAITAFVAVLPGAAGDVPLQSGGTMIIDRGSSTYMAAICAALQTATLYATVGVGG